MIKKFDEFLNENKREYGCAMAFFDSDNWNSITSLVNKEDLHNKGLENEIHVTLLFGLHDDINEDQLFSMLKTFPAISVFVNKFSIFENDEFDILKFDVKNNLLNSLNKQLTDNFEYTTNHPDYHPHITVAYLKKGTGKKYNNYKLADPIKLTSTKYVYSDKNSKQTIINI